jgi:hypothetical protein
VLVILGGGATVARHVDLGVYMGQRHVAGGFFAAAHELASTHPFLPKRIAALREFRAPGTVSPVPRPLLAYPMAPVLGMGSAFGGAAMVVFVMAIMAAVASFKRYMDQAKATEARVVAAREATKPPFEMLPESLKKADDDAGERVHGELFGWSMQPPSTRWRVLPSAQAHKQNPLADRWLVRPDLDAHVLVIAEPLAAGTLDEFADAVTANLKANATLEGIERAPWTVPGAQAVKLHLRATLNGLKIECLTGLVRTPTHGFQVMGFSSVDHFGQVRPDLEKALASFAIDASGATPGSASPTP